MLSVFWPYIFRCFSPFLGRTQGFFVFFFRRVAQDELIQLRVGGGVGFFSMV